MTGIGIVYAATNRMIDQIRVAYEEYLRHKEHLDMHPASQDAKRQFAVAKVTFNEVVDDARQRFQIDTDDGIAQMRVKNKRRVEDEPTTGQINVLSALKLIPHPSDELLYSVANVLKDNRLCLMALDAIVRAAWADDPGHECKRYSDMLKPEMTIKAADEAVTKLKKFCDQLVREEPEKVAGVTVYAGVNDLIVRELNIEPEPFMKAVSGI